MIRVSDKNRSRTVEISLLSIKLLEVRNVSAIIDGNSSEALDIMIDIDRTVTLARKYNFKHFLFLVTREFELFSGLLDDFNDTLADVIGSSGGDSDGDLSGGVLSDDVPSDTAFDFTEVDGGGAVFVALGEFETELHQGGEGFDQDFVCAAAEPGVAAVCCFSEGVDGEA